MGLPYLDLAGFSPPPSPLASTAISPQVLFRRKSAFFGALACRRFSATTLPIGVFEVCGVRYGSPLSPPSRVFPSSFSPGLHSDFPTGPFPPKIAVSAQNRRRCVSPFLYN